MLNEFKGFEQRLAEQQKNQNGHADPEKIAKAASMRELAQLKMQITAMQAQMKAMQKQQAFTADERRKDLRVIKEEKRKDVQAIGEQHRENVKTVHEVRRNKLKSFSDGGEE
jgi:hypothetical protein